MVPLVRAAALTNYNEVARAAGLDPYRMLADVGLSSNVLNEPDLRIPADRAVQLLEQSAKASGIESFGLRMAESRRLSNMGPVGLLIRDQPTLRDSMEVLLRYLAMLNGALSLTVEEAGGMVVIRDEVIVGSAQPVRQAVELSVGVILRMMRQFLGADWRPRRVCFVHAAPRDTSTHLRVFGPCVEFNHDFNGIVCSKAELDAANPSADPAMARYAQQLLDTSVVVQEPSLVDEVRRTVLLLLPSGRCSIEQVSAHLGLVCRTVQRRLADQGVSFSTLVNDLRVELATRHVENSERPLTEVAALLGFSAPSAFTRWYSAQFGSNPKRARELAHEAKASPRAKTAPKGR
ncbi:AraC family transcriptional regulator [Aquabacterium sp. NJ1]|uniref:AraC family transcriptional regulator n=1 Tax=Aquabacterium sp. NJ1 TaxID=1538295 RepID=UPI00052CEA00|nr:AraC family transcriptional regulator [Aquabacterium sp. NJ1]KGM40067.1 AraC family transcriptional regulator [Aquabacterium sp. NJ1]